MKYDNAMLFFKIASNGKFNGFQFPINLVKSC